MDVYHDIEIRGRRQSVVGLSLLTQSAFFGRNHLRETQLAAVSALEVQGGPASLEILDAAAAKAGRTIRQSCRAAGERIRSAGAARASRGS